MKQNSIFALMLAVMTTLVSCNGSEEDNTPKTVEFTATAATWSSGPQAVWNTGDKIGLFSDNMYTLTATTGGAKATFSGDIVKASRYFAISPYTSSTAISNGIVSASVPSEQIAVKDGLASDACVSVASSTTEDLVFKAVTGLLKFTLGSDNNIKAVTVTAKSNESLSGDVSINAGDGKITVKSGNPEIKLSAGSEVLAKGTYYLSAIPATYMDGLSIILTDEYGRVAEVNSDEFITTKAGATFDLGQIDASIEFANPTLTATPVDLAVKGDGEIVKASISKAFTSTSVIKAPSWAKVTVNGSEVSADVAANPVGDDARYGKIHIEGITTEGPAEIDFYIAQAAKGSKIVFDSFSGKEMNEGWKGNATRSSLKYGEGCLKMTGTGEYNNPSNTYPMFWMNDKVRQRYTEEEPNFNQFVCTIDIKADGGCGGIIAFNAFGYKEDGTCDFTSKQNYIVYMSATEGADGGGYYCMNANSANAMDNWTKPENTAITTWLRLEVSNVDRGFNEVQGKNWGLKAIWSLEEDEDGVLQKKDLLFHGSMWWWNDTPQLGTQYGYFGVFSKDATEASFRNFTLSYQDN